MMPEVYGRPQLHTHEAGTTVPQNHNTQQEHEGMDYPLFIL